MSQKPINSDLFKGDNYITANNSTLTETIIYAVKYGTALDVDPYINN
jgi:hypothetical protein